MRKEVNFSNAVLEVRNTIKADIPFAYDLWVDKEKDIRLSMVTGSHINSAKLSTVEVALMINGEFAFGEEESDNSIVHYMDLQTLTTMIFLYNLSKEEKRGQKIDFVLYSKDLFKTCKELCENKKEEKRMKVKDLKPGAVVWYKNLIVGITHCTLGKEYDECEVKPVGVNPVDFDLIPLNEEMEGELEIKILQQAVDDEC